MNDNVVDLAIAKLRRAAASAPTPEPRADEPTPPEPQLVDPDDPTLDEDWAAIEEEARRWTKVDMVINGQLVEGVYQRVEVEEPGPKCEHCGKRIIQAVLAGGSTRAQCHGCGRAVKEKKAAGEE